MRKLLKVLASLAVLVAGQATQADDVPGVTDDCILVGMTTDLSGPLAFVGQQESAGARLYLNHINEHGGVHGRQIELRVEDDGYQPPRTVAAFRKLLDRDGVFCFAGNMGTPTTMATLPFIQRAGVPLVGPLTNSSQMSEPPKEHVFAVDPNYPTQAWLLVQYIAEVEQASEARLAVVYQDDDAGRDGLKGMRAAAEHYGLPIVAAESYKRGSVDLGTQTLNLRQADPSHVILLTIYREGAAVMTEARQAGWQPQFLGWGPASVAKTVELAGDAAAGFLGLGIFDYESDAVPVERYRDLLAIHAPGEPLPSLYHTFGFGIAQVLVEGLRRAGPDLTRENLVQALETLDRWEGSILPSVTYGPGLRGGQFTSAFITRADVENNRLVRASDWLQYDPSDLVGPTVARASGD